MKKEEPNQEEMKEEAGMKKEETNETKGYNPEKKDDFKAEAQANEATFER